MPLITMASPFEGSQLHLHPNANAVNNDHNNNSSRGRKKRVVKILQFTLISVCILLFLMNSEITTTQPADALICVTFGMCFIFPILVLTDSMKYLSKNTIIFNGIGAILLLVIGAILIITYTSLHKELIHLTNINQDARMYNDVNLKLTTGIIIFFNGLLYAGETIIMYYNLYHWNREIIPY